MILGLLLLLSLALLGLFAPWIAPYDPLAIQPQTVKQPPSLEHLLGTDYAGRDVASRLLHSIRLAYQGGIAGTLITAIGGVTLGIIAGYRGGWLDVLIMRLVDFWLAIPNLLFLLVILSALDRGLPGVLIAVGLANIPSCTRFVRSVTIQEKGQPYMEASRALGASSFYIVFHHILPNISPLVATLLASYFGSAILAAGSLSFLGVGIKPPTPELGNLLREGYGVIRQAWWLTASPLLVLIWILVGVNLLSDALSTSR